MASTRIYTGVFPTSTEPESLLFRGGCGGYAYGTIETKAKISASTYRLWQKDIFV